MLLIQFLNLHLFNSIISSKFIYLFIFFHKKSCKIYAGKVGWEILFQYFEFDLITWLLVLSGTLNLVLYCASLSHTDSEFFE